jgi:hypothetical protein
MIGLCRWKSETKKFSNELNRRFLLTRYIKGHGDVHGSVIVLDVENMECLCRLAVIGVYVPDTFLISLF